MEIKDFYHKTFKGLFRYIYYKGLTKDETEDIVSEAYTRFLSGYQQLLTDKNTDEQTCIKLLYGIAKNVWRDFIEKRIVDKEKLVDFEDAEEVYGNLDEEIEKYGNDTIDKEIQTSIVMVNNAIEELNPTIKQVMKLKYLKNYTRKEIAVELGITEDNVHTYQKRGIRYLREKCLHFEVSFS